MGNSNPDLYVRNLKKKYPDMPNACLHCKLFLDTPTYKAEYEIYYGSGDKKVLFILPSPQEKIKLEKYITTYFKDYIVYITYAIKCNPGDTTCRTRHIRQCSSFLSEDIKEIRPDLVVTIGSISKDAWKEIDNEL